MKVTMDMSAYDVENAVWSGARDTVSDLSTDELQLVLDTLEEIECDNPEGISMTYLNDFLWFERDTIAEWLGYEDYDALLNDR